MGLAVYLRYNGGRQAAALQLNCKFATEYLDITFPTTDV